jgi:hypothetical protein
MTLSPLKAGRVGKKRSAALMEWDGGLSHGSTREGRSAAAQSSERQKDGLADMPPALPAQAHLQPMDARRGRGSWSEIG